jgi:uncharacterized membrane protein YfcA
MAPAETPQHGTLMRYWPFGVGGLVGPLLALALSRWMPFPLAVGTSIFVAFSAAVWMFRARSARMREGVGRSMAAILLPGCAAGVVAGALAFLFPWR